MQAKWISIAFLLFTAVTILYVGLQSKRPATAMDPNPMKINQEQFVRINPAYVADAK